MLLISLTASKEEVEEKLKNKRIEFLPISLCDTATEIESDLEIERPHVSFF